MLQHNYIIIDEVLNQNTNTIYILKMFRYFLGNLFLFHQTVDAVISCFKKFLPF